MHDMTKYKTKDKTRQRRENHIAYPEMARVGVTNMASYMRGVTGAMVDAKEVDLVGEEWRGGAAAKGAEFSILAQGRFEGGGR